LLRKRGAERVAGHDGVHALDRDEVPGREYRGGVGHERLAERVDLCALDVETRGRAVPGEPLQVLGPRGPAGVEVERGDAASRPAAFSRGASWTPSACSVTAPGSSPATLISAHSPTSSVLPSARSPSRTSRRFSPFSGTTSATVASATRSRSRSASAGSAPATVTSASVSFWTTPAAHRSGNG